MGSPRPGPGSAAPTPRSGPYALFSGSADAQRAIGATWLGAGVVRLAAKRRDRPSTDTVYWGSLAMELGLGAAALLTANRRRR